MTRLSDVQEVHIAHVDRELYKKFKALCRAEGKSANAKHKELIREAVDLNRGDKEG